MNKLNRLLAGGYELGELDPIASHLEPGTDPLSSLEQIISVIIGFLTAVGGLWFAIQIILAALQLIGNDGDKGKAAMAREKITQSAIGLIILVAAYTIISFVGGLLGLDIFNPAAVLSRIWSQ